MKISTTLLLCCLLGVCSSGTGQSVAPPVDPLPEAGTPSQVAMPEAERPDASAQAVSVSQVRIVRLSQVTGQVELDRKSGSRFDSAFVNLPIVAGAGLRTRQGLAEVEFEDNSSMRLTPQSQVEFSRLGRGASGATITAVNMLRGSLYVSLADSKAGGDFTVNVGNQSIVISPSTHLRLDLEASTAKMAVFQGTATLSGPSGSLVVTKKKEVSFDTASAAAPQFAHIEEAFYDSWDKNAVDYHKVRANTAVAGLSSSLYGYGLNDLSYYGSFSNIGGCGTMWRPHLANAAFDPYSSGVWSWYPGQGYSWVSLYPWGWTPFHSGSWDYCPAGGGWGWRPQGTWLGLINHPTLLVRGPDNRPVHGPVRPTPPAPPQRGQPTLIGVNLKSLQPSQQGPDGKFVFRAGSAGLGVPRGTFSNLARISQDAETHGSATKAISEHQAQVGLLAPGRSSSAASSNTAIAFRSAAARGSSASASGSFAANHSISPTSSSVGSSMSTSAVSTSSSPASSGSFSSAGHASSAGTSASAGGASHH